MLASAVAGTRGDIATATLVEGDGAGGERFDDEWELVSAFGDSDEFAGGGGCDAGFPAEVQLDGVQPVGDPRPGCFQFDQFGGDADEIGVQHVEVAGDLAQPQIGGVENATTGCEHRRRRSRRRTDRPPPSPR